MRFTAGDFEEVVSDSDFGRVLGKIVGGAADREDL